MQITPNDSRTPARSPTHTCTCNKPIDTTDHPGRGHHVRTQTHHNVAVQFPTIDPTVVKPKPWECYALTQKRQIQQQAYMLSDLPRYRMLSHHLGKKSLAGDAPGSSVRHAREAVTYLAHLASGSHYQWKYPVADTDDLSQYCEFLRRTKRRSIYEARRTQRTSHPAGTHWSQQKK